jgi:RNA polymerase sigma factor (sigma-70 family)
VQEAFLRVFSADMPETMSADHLKNYLYKVATNLARRRARFSYREQLVNAPETACTSRLDDVVAVRSALASMSVRDRGLLWLAYVENLSHRDIAAISGYRENSVRTLVHRAKEKLIRLLAGSERT